MRLTKMKKAILYRLDIVLFLGAWFFVFFQGPRNVLWGVGLGVSAVCFVLWMVARVQLGRSFAVKAKATELVTTGLYRWVSHPIYYFGAVADIALAVAFQHWLISPLWCCLIPVQWFRLKREDQVLQKKFGDAFLRHRERTLV